MHLGKEEVEDETGEVEEERQKASHFHCTAAQYNAASVRDDRQSQEMLKESRFFCSLLLHQKKKKKKEEEHQLQQQQRQ